LKDLEKIYHQRQNSIPGIESTAHDLHAVDWYCSYPFPGTEAMRTIVPLHDLTNATPKDVI